MTTPPDPSPPQEVHVHLHLHGPRHPWFHWGFITTFLYLLLATTLTLPVLYLAFPDQVREHGFPWRIFGMPGYVVLMATLMLSQFLLVRVPIHLRYGRPVRRSALWLPILVTGFWMGLLVLGAFVTIVETMEWKLLEDRTWPGEVLPILLGIPATSWLLWSVYFWRQSAGSTPAELARRQSRWALRGSILELLVAVPTHVLARQRPDCCAGFMTFFGITMGLCVMMVAFGPGVLILFHARWRARRR